MIASVSILVTGATGFMGGNMAKRLVDEGERVVGIVHDDHPMAVSRLLGIHDEVDWAHGSILDSDFVKRVFSDYEVQKVYHFAALPIVRAALRAPASVFQTNIQGTWNMLEAARDCNADFMYISTDKVYGNAGEAPITEDFPLNGLGIYESSKACADLLARAYNYEFALRAVVTRTCNTFGPCDLNPRIVPNTIRSCLKGESPLIYQGVAHVREYIYVDDVTAAYKLLMDNIERASGKAYNISTGQALNQEQLVREIVNHFPGIRPQIASALSYMKKEIAVQRLSGDKLKREFGWNPKISFSEGISRTIAWWNANKKRILSISTLPAK